MINADSEQLYNSDVLNNDNETESSSRSEYYDLSEYYDCLDKISSKIIKIAAPVRNFRFIDLHL